MVLKQLELTGFKSFVDPTRLDFTQGFTAVVGPNGCGKSNISDAIRWVIGEQSSKTLRGTRITDLIFNGSSQRKPVNRTEITITLGNVPEGLRIANIPNLSEEIKVTRCYHRSGESEFYINQVPCRLKDITDMFLDVGISPKVLTIIEQGHVMDLVTSKPEDRRIWIEEAAGVLKFKVRKQEALRKLESAGQNLDRISDIVQELSRQVESLKRQAAKAERYKQFQSEIKELSLNLFSKKIRRFQGELEEIEETLTQETEQKAQWSARSSTLENQVTQLKIEIDELSRSLNEKKENLQQLTGQIQQNEHNIELKKSQIESAQQDIASAREEISRMNQEIESHQEETRVHQQELEGLSSTIAEEQETCDSKVREFEHGKGLMAELEGKVKSCENHVLELFNRVAQQKNQITALETRRHFLQARDEKLKGEQEEARVQIEAAQVARDASQIDYQEKVQSLESRKAQQIDLQQQLVELTAKLAANEEELHSAREAYLGKSSLLNSLRELRGKFEGFGEGVKALMGHANGESPAGLKEVLVDVISAPPEFETAIEAVMGERLQSIIVDSYSDTVEAIRYLREHKSGRGSFIPVHPKAVQPGPLYLNGDQGVIGKLADLIETREEYRSIFQHLLGQVVLVRDLDTALHLHGQDAFQGTVVTLAGEVIDSQGMVSGGLDPEQASGLLMQNREMDELSHQVDALKQELEFVQKTHGELTGQSSALNEKHQAAGAAVHEAEIERADSRRDLEQNQKELDRLQQKLSTLDYERSTGNHELEELAREHETLQSETMHAEVEKNELEVLLSELKGTLDGQRQGLERQSEGINALKVQITSLKGRQENMTLEIRRLELQQENLAQRIEKREGDCRANQEKIEACREEIAGFEKLILEHSEASQGLGQIITKEEESLLEKDEAMDGWEKESRELIRQTQEISETISQWELKRSELNIQISHLEERAWEDFNVALDEMLRNYDGEVDEEEASDKLSVLKEKIGRLGEVNLAALSDFQVANERYLFLQKQLDDLADSIHALHQTVEKIDKTTRQLFIETFEEVNHHFKENFQRLFLGGKAELSMVDPEDPLETGIEITASPAGKAMHNITLLSGGEKSMTAIALIFAILKVRPSPFCLLDEVDAALDEANVVRFHDMLKEMSGKTQFIIITHNQKSMSFANTLYGVTMEERGVSKVVSVNLN